MATTTNFGWETPDDTDLVKDGAAAMRTLGNSIDTSFVDLKGGTTGQVLSKASNTDLDYTWVTTDDANAIQNAIVDAKGDLIAASAADTPARLAVGANDLLLTAASGEATGLKYTGGWTSYTPTLTNIVKGNGTEIARYCQIGKTVTVFYSLTLGSTSSISQYPIISLPVNNVNFAYATGTGTFTDAGVLSYFGRVWMNTSTGSYAVVDRTDAAYSKFEPVGPNIPFTWGTGDLFILNFSYEVA